MVHTFNLSTLCVRGPAWSTKIVKGQLGVLHRETLSWKTETSKHKHLLYMVRSYTHKTLSMWSPKQDKYNDNTS